jgi:acetylornithine deacetylase/succinyl-diaminopimelate desuccinylase-like protein
MATACVASSQTHLWGCDGEFKGFRVNRTAIVVNALVIAMLSLVGGAALNAQSVSAAGSASNVVRQVREYRLTHEGAIVRELAEFLAIPNVANDEPNSQKNAARLVEMMKARGVETELLPIVGRGPVVFGKLMTPGAKRTVIFYAHYDGQPVDAAAWTDGKPFEPVLRDNSIEAGGKRIPFPDAGAAGSYKDDWRIYARSSSDDKSPIIGILAAIDALRAQKIPIGVNVKMIFEGEEEAGSTNLEKTLQAHKDLLGADLLLTCDGPVHPSGRALIFFGARGDIGLDVTVYGPVRALQADTMEIGRRIRRWSCRDCWRQ